MDHQMCFLGLEKIGIDQLEVIELAKMSKGVALYKKFKRAISHLGTERPIQSMADERFQCPYVLVGTFLRIKQKCRFS